MSVVCECCQQEASILVPVSPRKPISVVAVEVLCLECAGLVLTERQGILLAANPAPVGPKFRAWQQRRSAAA